MKVIAKYRLRKMLHRLFAVIMVICMFLTVFPTSAFADENASTVGTTPTKSTVVDTDTKDNYNEVLGAANSTEYDGRVWVDKSVSNEDISFTKENEDEAFNVKKVTMKIFLSLIRLWPIPQVCRSFPKIRFPIPSLCSIFP